MKIIKPSVEIIEQGSGLDGIYKQIELAGRECYQSKWKIEEGSAKPFVEMLIRSGHLAALEHGTVYLQIPSGDASHIQLHHNLYTKIVPLYEAGCYFVTTNYRVLVENKWLDLLQYMVEPQSLHQRRVTARFVCQIAISREYNRHRVDSICEESTRYCNYSKGRFGSEIKVCQPSWVDDETVERVMKEVTINTDEFGHRKIKLGFEPNEYNPQVMWILANLEAEKQYLYLLHLGWQAQQARTVLPLDTATTLVHTAFISDWQHFFELRCAQAAHPDARLLANNLRDLMVNKNLIPKPNEEQCEK